MRGFCARLESLWESIGYTNASQVDLSTSRNVEYSLLFILNDSISYIYASRKMEIIILNSIDSSFTYSIILLSFVLLEIKEFVFLTEKHTHIHT